MNVLLHWFTTPEWTQLVKTLLHSLWQGALITIALALAIRRLTNPHWRYRCSFAALTAIPLAAIITWATLNVPQAPLPTPTTTTPPLGAAFDLPAPDGTPDVKLALLVNHPPVSAQFRWSAWLALAWLIGAIAMLGRAGVKVTGAEQLRRASQPLDNPQITQLVAEARRAIGLVRRIRIAVTDQITSPAVVGVIVPTLILPLTLVTTLTPEQIRFILLHELAHIRRGDYFANLFQLFVESLLFFNPAVWWISHQVRREREACCDALAIELSGAPTDYARTLVHVAENILSPSPTAAPAFGDEREPSSLADRVQRLLVPGYRPSLRMTWRAMIAAFALGALLLMLCAEGTRVAVAQITKPTDKPARTSNDGLATGNPLAPSDHFTNEFRLGEPVSSGPASPRLPAMAKITESPELERVKRKLNDIRFDFVACSNKPFGEFFRDLSEQSELLDKDGGGLRYSIVPVRFRALLATIDPPLTNANLHEILAALRSVSRLQLNGITTNGLVTLSPSPSFGIQDNPASQHTPNAGSIVTNSAEVQISGASSASQVQYDIAAQRTVATNGGIVRFKDIVVRADTIQLDHRTGTLIASGNFRVERPGYTNSGTRIELNIHSNQPSTRTTVTSKGQQAIADKLNQIVLERVEFEAMPLSNVVHAVSSEVRRLDWGGGGVNFLINPNAPSPGDGRTVDIGDTRITLKPPLTNVRLGDALDAILMGADRPLKLSIEDYAVVFSLKGKEPTRLFMREFNLDPAIFFPHLVEYGYPAANHTNFTHVASSIRSLFASTGVDLDPMQGKSVFYSDRRGVLLVRATMEELDIIEAVVMALNRPEPQVNIKARFVEVPASLMDSVTKDFLGTNLANIHGWTTILTKLQADEFLNRLKATQGVGFLSEGEVTTSSGRQAQLQVVDLKQIVTGINPLALTRPGITSTNDDVSAAFQTQQIPLGPILDVIAYVSADEDTIQLTAIPSFTEFLGYSSTNVGTVYVNGREQVTPLPRPMLRTHQATNNAIVWDGQTVVSGNPPISTTVTVQRSDGKLTTTQLFAEPKPSRTNILLVLITPTVVDSAGNHPRPPTR